MLLNAANCSCLIDVFARATYNRTVEERAIEDFICMEKVAPKRGAIRSHGVLYALLLAAVLFAMALGNALTKRFAWPRAAVQLPLYAMVLLLGVYLYRVRMVSYRYTLTNRTLTIERYVGTHLHARVPVPLAELEAMAQDHKPRGARVADYGLRRGNGCVLTLTDGRRLVIDPTEEFIGKLRQQWTNVNA